MPLTKASQLSTVSITGLEEQLVYNLTIKSSNSLGLGYSEPYLLCKLNNRVLKNQYSFYYKYRCTRSQCLPFNECRRI